jgi:hypothetical protein
MPIEYSAKPKGKAALPLLGRLGLVDPDVQCERRFDWLFLPDSKEMSVGEARVAAALIEHCRHTKSAHPRKAACTCEAMFADERVRRGISRRLEFDFWLPNFGVAIEFDGRQHFTRERGVTFEYYEGGFPFDIAAWAARCAKNVQDPDPPCRDWVRAFRDTVRDFRARAHGVCLMRLYYRDTSLATCDLKNLIDNARARA